MLEIKVLGFKDLTDEEKKNVPNNGHGKEYATCIKVLHNGHLLGLFSDAIEPEDAIFLRDFSWIPGLLNKCYAIGKQDAQQNITE